MPGAVGRAFLLVASALSLALLRITPTTWWAGSSFAAASTIFWFRESSLGARGAAALLGIVLSASYAATHSDAHSWLTALAYGMGTASFCVAAARAILAEPGDFSRRFRTALVVSIFLVSLYAGAPVLEAAAVRTPLTFDSILTAADRSLGGNFSFAVGAFLRSHLILRALSRAAYYGMPVVVMLAAGLRWRRYGVRDETSIPLSVTIGAVLAPFLYWIVPAAGPVFRWGANFPLNPGAAGPVGMTQSHLERAGVLNAMPSLHFAYALLVLWGMWSMGFIARFVGIGFVLLTGLATLGLGEHYLVDLIAAVPFAVMLDVVVRRTAGWQRALAMSGGLTAAWLLLLRLRPSVWGEPAFVWGVVIVTAAGLFAIRDLKPPLGAHLRKRGGPVREELQIYP